MNLRRYIVSVATRLEWKKAARRVGKVRVLTDKTIEGSIAKSAWSIHRADQVELFINDLRVMTARVDGAEKSLNFTFGVHDFWRFAQREDLVSVKYAGLALAMPSGRLSEHPRRNGKENLAKLQRRLEKGQGFDGQGKIYMPPKDEDIYWQQGVLELYAKVDKVIRSVTGSRSFIYSGTLLGYVRENGFIPHDKDMDCAYVSQKEGPEAVSAEFENLGSALIDAGFHTTPKASCISVRERGGSRVMVDIAHLFVKSDGHVGFPFGTVGTEDVPTEDLLPVLSGSLGGFPVGLPQKPEATVSHIYGADWRIPNPDFKWSKERRRRDAQALLSYTQRSRLAMDDYYSHDAATHPSDFSVWLAAQPAMQECRSIIDIGCGNGRDVTILAGSDRHVVAVDRSQNAVSSAADLLKDIELVRVIHADVLESSKLADLAESCRSRSSGPVLFYLRFVLNGLTSSEEARLFQELRNATQEGDYVALEHRTDLDDGRRKAFFRSFRRFIPAADTVHRLREAELDLIVVDTGTGRAKFYGEDPEVARFLALRAGD